MYESRAPEEDLAGKVRSQSHQPMWEWSTLSRERVSEEKKRGLQSWGTPAHRGW